MRYRPPSSTHNAPISTGGLYARSCCRPGACGTWFSPAASFANSTLSKACIRGHLALDPKICIMDLGFVKDGDSTLMFTLTPPQTKDAGIEVSKGCYCFVIDVSGRWALLRARPPWPCGSPSDLFPRTAS